jgi:hypothetical protein
MYDSTTAADIPADATIVAGYLDGTWPTFAALVARFPTATHVSIATTAATRGADVYDVEQGDLTPVQCPGVWQRERAAGREPVAYVNRSNIVPVLNAFATARMAPPRFWVATLDNSRPWAPNVVAIQYAGQNLTGGHYDCSDVIDDWPAPRPKETRMLILLAPDGFQYLVSGSMVVHIPNVADSAALQAAGVKLAPVDQPFADAVKAAAAALAQPAGATGHVSGTLTVS